MIEALRDPNAKVRVTACLVLANQGAELQQVIPVLSAAVGDENPEIRLEAAACLGRISPQKQCGLPRSATPARVTHSDRYHGTLITITRRKPLSRR